MLPAEWVPQRGIQLTWPHAGTDWEPYLDEITKTFVEMARAITCDERLYLISPAVPQTKTLLEKQLTDNQLTNITFHQINSKEHLAA